MVEDCMPNGPAGRSGLKARDYVMEVNGIPVKHHESAAAMIKAAQGRPLRLGVLSMARRPKRLSSSMRVLSQSGDSVRESRAQKAMEFNKKVSLKYVCLSGWFIFVCISHQYICFYIRWRTSWERSQMWRNNCLKCWNNMLLRGTWRVWLRLCLISSSQRSISSSLTMSGSQSVNSNIYSQKTKTDFSHSTQFSCVAKVKGNAESQLWKCLLIITWGFEFAAVMQICQSANH